MTSFFHFAFFRFKQMNYLAKIKHEVQTIHNDIWHMSSNMTNEKRKKWLRNPWLSTHGGDQFYRLWAATPPVGGFLGAEPLQESREGVKGRPWVKVERRSPAAAEGEHPATNFWLLVLQRWGGGLLLKMCSCGRINKINENYEWLN